MIQKVKVTKVYMNNKDKAGNQLVTKTGKPYSKIAIKTAEHGNEWLSSMVWNPMDKVGNIKEGDEILVKVEKNGAFVNFKLATKTDVLEEKVNEMNDRLAIVEANQRKMFETGGAKIYPPHTPDPDTKLAEAIDDPINPDDIPF